MPVARKSIAEIMSVRCSLAEIVFLFSKLMGTLVIWWVSSAKSLLSIEIVGQRFFGYSLLTFFTGVKGITARLFKESRRLVCISIK